MHFASSFHPVASLMCTLPDGMSNCEYACWHCRRWCVKLCACVHCLHCDSSPWHGMGRLIVSLQGGSWEHCLGDLYSDHAHLITASTSVWAHQGLRLVIVSDHKCNLASHHDSTATFRVQETGKILKFMPKVCHPVMIYDSNDASTVEVKKLLRACRHRCHLKYSVLLLLLYKLRLDQSWPFVHCASSAKFDVMHQCNILYARNSCMPMCYKKVCYNKVWYNKVCILPLASNNYLLVITTRSTTCIHTGEHMSDYDDEAR
jgi:hypothetical protein